MYLKIAPNGYHSPSPISHSPSIIASLVDTYRKRAKRKIAIEEYRKTI